MSYLLLIPLLLPLGGGLAVGLVRPLKGDRVRNGFTLAVLLVTLGALIPILLTRGLTLPLFTLSDRLPVFLQVDATGKFFAGVFALVWCAVGLYSFGYLSHAEHKDRFYAFYLITLSALMGLCFAGSMVTYYMFYELMTLLTVPLVVHEQTTQAVAAGLKYLIYSVAGASLVLLGLFLLSPALPGFAFSAGGCLDPAAVQTRGGTVLAGAFLMLLGFSTKAGMFPMHGWLPTAHPVAPAPASAVLSGIITKAGVLGVVRTVYFLVGAPVLRGSWVQTAYLSMTLFTFFMGSMLAYREQGLKKRLAYSSVSQVSYVLLGLATMTPAGLVGALLHVAAHALIKNTLFTTAGSVIHQTGKTQVGDLTGLGRRMPVTMWCFTVAAVGLVGIPPCLGFVSKWYLAQGALAMEGVAGFFNILAPAVLLVSALLTAGYLIVPAIRAFFPGQDGQTTDPRCEAPWGMLLPMVLLAALVVVLGVFPGGLVTLFGGIAAGV